MKKVVIFVLLLVVSGIVLTVLFRASSPQETDSASLDSRSGTGMKIETNRSEPVKAENPPARTLDNSETPIVGKKPYDTGIKNDGRVQATEEGKHVVIEAVQIAEGLHSPDSSAEEDLEYIEQILGIYRLSFQQNPVAGDNQMVMEALLGSNPRELVVFPGNHPAINAKGELLDRWGNPYFFHALSGTEMEIFSAGPDGKFNTSDDVQRSDRDGQPLTGAELNTELDAGI